MVKHDLIQMVLHFFRTEHIIPSLNNTFITMIPKGRGSTNLGDYRPISCIGTPYKRIAKILSARLGEILPKFISANQTGFLKGRRISDNIGLAHEFSLGFNRKNSSKRAIISLDFRKTFDSIRWDAILVTLGIHRV